MKKIIACVLLAVIVLTLGACGDGGGTTAATTTAPTPAGPIGFDYYGSDISEYCMLPPAAYAAPTLSLDVSEEELDEYFEMLLRWNPKEILLTDRAVVSGDITYIYYTGKIDGVAFEGGSNASDPKPYALKIGSGAFIPGFEDALIGMVPSATSKDSPAPITVTFPENYGSADLAGKEAVFEIWLVGISGGYTARTELTAEFLTGDLGYKTEESDVVAAYRAEIRAQMKKDAEKNYEGRLRGVMLDFLRDAANEIVCPEQELARYRRIYMEQLEYYYQMYAMYGQVSSLDEMAEMYFGLGRGADWETYLDELCVDIVEEYLLVYAVAKSEGITVSDTEYAARLAELAAANEMTESELVQNAGTDYIYNSVIFDKVFDFLTARAVIDNGTLTVPAE